jgi:hypothetical protein
MGSITRSLANNITTSGVILPAGITNASVADVTSFANAAAAGTLILLSTQTASSSANISFTTGLNSTYDEYQFHFINMHPATDAANFTFNMSTDSGSNYNVTKTTTVFRAYHFESDSATELAYETTEDLAQSTAFQILTPIVGNDNDQQCSGVLTLFNPASTTYVKHFISRGVISSFHDLTTDHNVAGYCNTTSAVNAVRFQFSSGNIDDGIIKLYGVKKS